MPLSFQPACLPVAQGGLPHHSLTQALDLLQRTTPTVLTCPHLPRRGLRDQEWVQSVIGFPGLVLDATPERVYVERDRLEQELDRLSLAYLQDNVAFAALKTEDAALFAELQQRLGAGSGRHVIKCQVMGPISLALQLTDDQQRPVIYDPMLHEALAQHLVLRISWLTAQLRKLTSHVIICLEEPFLDILGSPFCPLDWDEGVALLEMVLTSITGCRGVCTSAMITWGNLFSTSVELVHFNAYTYGQTLLEAVGLFSNFVDRSGVLVWGLVPADEEALAYETVTTLRMRFENLLDDLVTAGISRDDLLQGALISTSGSLSTLSLVAAERALTLCAALSAQLRADYGLE